MKKKIYLVIVVILVGIIIARFLTRDNLSSIISKQAPEKVVGLNQFQQWTKEDPLFTSPDFDSEAFLKSVNTLGEEEKLVQGYLSSKDPLYPVTFLKDVVEVDKFHKDFLANPEASKAKNLIAAYRKAQQDYQSSVESLAKILQDTAQFPDESVFTGINTVTNYKIIRDDLRKLGLNAQKLNEEINQREKCLKTGADCVVLPDQISEPQLQTESFKFTQKDILPKNILLIDYKKDAPLFGPYVVATACYGWSSDLKPIYYPFLISDKMQNRAFPQLNNTFLKVATTNYYKRLITAPNGPGSYLEKSGNQWINQRETQLYMCNDPSYEADLTTLDKFYRSYKPDPLFEKTLGSNDLPDKLKQAAQKGSDLEKAFFKEEFPSEISAANLAKYYFYFYQLSKKEEYLTRSLEYQRKLGNIDLLFSNMIQNVNQIRVRFTIAKENKGASTFIYGFRNFYGLTYLTFSPSFYRLTEPLAYLSTKKIEIPVESRGAHITYQQALKDHTPEEIAKWRVDNNALLQEQINSFKKEHPDTKL